MRLTVDGLGLHVVVEGEGEPVLLLHGFPDSSALWRRLLPHLTRAGYRAVAPDLRGFGRSEAPEDVESYSVDVVAKDVIALLDELGIDEARLVGHDWGAVVGWLLAGAYPDRLSSLVALSVGHPRAYLSAGWRQKLRGWYVLFFQLRGVAEKAIAANDFRLFRKAVRHHPEAERWIEDLSRPGRLTAALNWYRANFTRLLGARFPPVRIPVLGVWSTGDAALVERQMTASAAFVDAPWRYERLHNVGHWIPLDVPDRLAELLVDFYRGASEPPSSTGGSEHAEL